MQLFLPQLSIDYACEPVFDICKNNKWKYLIRFNEGRIKSIAKEFSTLKVIEGKKNESCTWINEIDYNHSKVNLIEAEIEDESGIKRAMFS